MTYLFPPSFEIEEGLALLLLDHGKPMRTSCIYARLAAELAVHPSDAALFNGKVHIRKELIEPYVAGDTDWLDHWPKPPQ